MNHRSDYFPRRYSRRLEDKAKRPAERISDNAVYVNEDVTASFAPRDDASGEYPPEVREFYRMRIRDADACDDPILRLAEFFEHRPEEVVEVEWKITLDEVLMLHRALTQILGDWEELPPSPLRGNLFRPLQHLAFEVEANQWDRAPTEARRYWRHADGRRLCVAFSEGADEINLAGVMTRRVDLEFVTQLWPRLQEWMRANHYLREKKFGADLRFISMPKENVWSRLILPDPVRCAIRANTVEFLRRRPLHRRYELPLKRGLLLHGPPGTGKTMIGRAIAQECNCTFILASAADVWKPDLMRRLYKLAGKLAPTIVFFEDLDLLGGESRHNSERREILGELLTCLDGIASPDGIITIATTNDLAAIEPALKDRPSRFDVVLEIAPLDRSDCLRYISEWFDSRQMVFDADPELPADVARLTGAELQEACTSAAIKALDRISTVESDGPLKIRQEDLHEGIRQVRGNKKPKAVFGEPM